jgi:uncharacterized protein (TIGR02001 family)
VTVPAAAAASRARSSCTRLAGHFAICLFGFWAFPARAELGGTVSVFNDLRFRGYSLSDGRPVATLDFAYDDPSGFYADVSGTGVLRHGGEPAPLGFQLNGGYAKQLKSGTTLDLGVIHSSYSHYSSGERGASYTELYAGISRGALSSRIYLSPHYFAPGVWTAYGEVNAAVSPARKWSIDGHVGMHVPLRTPSGENYRKDFDWRIGVSRELGRLSLHAAWTDGTPGKDYYNGHNHSRSAVLIGANWVL